MNSAAQAPKPISDSGATHCFTGVKERVTQSELSTNNLKVRHIDGDFQPSHTATATWQFTTQGGAHKLVTPRCFYKPNMGAEIISESQATDLGYDIYKSGSLCTYAKNGNIVAICHKTNGQYPFDMEGDTPCQLCPQPHTQQELNKHSKMHKLVLSTCGDGACHWGDTGSHDRLAGNSLEQSSDSRTISSPPDDSLENRTKMTELAGPRYDAVHQCDSLDNQLRMTEPSGPRYAAVRGIPPAADLDRFDALTAMKPISPQDKAPILLLSDGSSISRRQSETIIAWHLRLGNLNFATVCKLLGISYDPSAIRLCVACYKAKMHMMPHHFGKLDRASGPLRWIWMDGWCPWSNI